MGLNPGQPYAPGYLQLFLFAVLNVHAFEARRTAPVIVTSSRGLGSRKHLASPREPEGVLAREGVFGVSDV